LDAVLARPPAYGPTCPEPRRAVALGGEVFATTRLLCWQARGSSIDGTQAGKVAKRPNRLPSNRPQRAASATPQGRWPAPTLQESLSGIELSPPSPSPFGWNRIRFGFVA